VFPRGFSIEATRPTPAELAELAGLLDKTTPIYLSAVPSQSYRELAAAAAGVRKLGFEPVAHVAARRLCSADEFTEFLKQVRGEADMRRLLVVAGDSEHAAGPFNDALSVIVNGALREAGIEEIGIAGYPEGHPRIAPEAIDRALDAKIVAAANAGLRLHIVSQFSFRPARIVAWLKRLRLSEIKAPVRVGMAGPTSLPALLRYARRCGVRASVQGLMSGAAAALVGQVVGSQVVGSHVGPDRIIEALGVAGAEVGDIAPHYFSFGGVVQTARYARDAGAGRLAGERAISRSN
jgi:methylenetetrahydrofolate reductase (NADPH)